MNRKSEWPLIIFTLLSQTAAGVSILTGLFSFVFPQAGWINRDGMIPMLCLALLIAGTAVSVFHLGHPLGSIRSLANLKRSWLSREILAVGIYAAALLHQLVFTFIYTSMSPLIRISVVVSAAAAVLFIYTSARVYKNPGYPSLNNHVPVTAFFITAFVMGLSVLGILIPNFSPGHQLSLFMIPLLLIVLVFHILIPVFWLNSDSASRQTAVSYFCSAAYWTRAAVLGAGLLIFWNIQNPGWIWVVIISGGELAGRMLFFNRTVHLSEQIGKPDNPNIS